MSLNIWYIVEWQVTVNLHPTILAQRIKLKNTLTQYKRAQQISILVPVYNEQNRTNSCKNMWATFFMLNRFIFSNEFDFTKKPVCITAKAWWWWYFYIFYWMCFVVHHFTPQDHTDEPTYIYFHCLRRFIGTISPFATYTNPRKIGPSVITVFSRTRYSAVLHTKCLINILCIVHTPP